MTVEEFIEAVAPIPKAKIYHAAQLRDFETYVARGCVVPRGALFELPPTEYTPFGSDAADVGGGHADDFFGNLLDQGYFSNYGRGIPNVYGSLTLVFAPTALRNAGSNEVYVRRRAIWSADTAAREILDAQQVRELYNDAGYARSGEIQIVGGTLHLADLRSVIVSSARGDALFERVQALLGRFNEGRFPIQVYPRLFSPEGYTVYGELVDWARAAEVHGGAYESMPAALQQRFAHLGDWKYANLKRFAHYLEHGTLSALRGENGHLAPNVAVPFDDEGGYYDEEYWLDGLTSLDEDQLFERDEAIWNIERAEFRLQQARLVADEDERANQVEARWDDYVEAIEALNSWIETTRQRILANQNEVHERFQQGHDSQLSANLGAWADEFEEVEIPTLNASAKEHDLLDWRKVREYSETGW